MFFSACQCFSVLVCSSAFQCLSVSVFASVCVRACMCACVCLVLSSVFNASLLLFATVCQGLPMPGWCEHTCSPPPPPPLFFVVFIRSKTNGAFNDLMYYFGPLFLFFFAQPKKNAHTNTLDLLPQKGPRHCRLEAKADLKAWCHHTQLISGPFKNRFGKFAGGYMRVKCACAPVCMRACVCVRSFTDGSHL